MDFRILFRLIKRLLVLPISLNFLLLIRTVIFDRIIEESKIDKISNASKAQAQNSLYNRV